MCVIIRPESGKELHSTLVRIQICRVHHMQSIMVDYSTTKINIYSVCSPVLFAGLFFFSVPLCVGLVVVSPGAA